MSEEIEGMKRQAVLLVEAKERALFERNQARQESLKLARQVESYRRSARDIAVSALNSAFGWDEHPSYSTKTDILTGLRSADAVLCAIAHAENDGAWPNVIVGIDRRRLHDVIELVRTRDGYSGKIRQMVSRAIILPAPAGV